MARTTAIRTGSTSRATSRPHATSPCSFATRSACPRSGTTRGCPARPSRTAASSSRPTTCSGASAASSGARPATPPTPGGRRPRLRATGGVGITAVVLGSPTEAQRDGDLAALLRFGLDSYRRVTVVDPGRTYATLPVGWGLAPVPRRRAAADRPADVDRPAAHRAGRRPGRPRASGRRGPAGRDDRGRGRLARRRAVAARRVRVPQRARGRGKGVVGHPPRSSSSRGARLLTRRDSP